MKGVGAFLMLIFLFFCFVWGIGSVVAGIRGIFSSKGHVAGNHDQNNAVMVELEEKGNDTFEKLKKAGELHKEGILSTEEFSKLKEKLINKIQ